MLLWCQGPGCRSGIDCGSKYRQGVDRAECLAHLHHRILIACRVRVCAVSRLFALFGRNFDQLKLAYIEDEAPIHIECSGDELSGPGVYLIHPRRSLRRGSGRSSVHLQTFPREFLHRRLYPIPNPQLKLYISDVSIRRSSPYPAIVPSPAYRPRQTPSK